MLDALVRGGMPASLSQDGIHGRASLPGLVAKERTASTLSHDIDWAPLGMHGCGVSVGSVQFRKRNDSAQRCTVERLSSPYTPPTSPNVLLGARRQVPFHIDELPWTPAKPQTHGRVSTTPWMVRLA